MDKLYQLKELLIRSKIIVLNPISHLLTGISPAVGMPLLLVQVATVSRQMVPIISAFLVRALPQLQNWKLYLASPRATLMRFLQFPA